MLWLRPLIGDRFDLRVSLFCLPVYLSVIWHICSVIKVFAYFCCLVTKLCLTLCNPWTAACQAALSFTISLSLLKFMSIELVMLSNHFILCHSLLLSPWIFPSIRVFSNELTLYIRWPKYWRFNFSINSSNEHSRLISFRIDWFDLLAIQGIASGGGGDGLVTKSCLTLVTPWMVACQALLSMGFSRQAYWSGLPFPSAGDLPEPGIEPRSPALQADSLQTELWGKPIQETIKSLLQYRSSKASILWHSTFFMVRLSYLYMTTG